MGLIKQGYSSESVKSFNFVNHFKLNNKINPNDPVIIFGVYNKQDRKIIESCKSHITIYWCGSDASNNNNQIPINFFKNHKSIRHITCLNYIPPKLKEFGINCELIPPMRSFYDERSSNFDAIKKGKKIFCYLPTHNRKGEFNSILKNHYGGDIIDQLFTKDELIKINPVKNGEINIKKWKNSIGKGYYEKCFIGLALSPYGGGGGGVIEMGMCGLKVITNVIDGPHVLNWSSKDDIIKHIKNERETIGMIDFNLREKVLDYLVDEYDWLKI